MKRLGLRYVSLTCSPVESLEEQIRLTKPHLLLGNVESLTSPDIQRRISKLNISYIAVDEAQVEQGLTLAIFESFCFYRLLIPRPDGTSDRIRQCCGGGCAPPSREHHSCSVLPL